MTHKLHVNSLFAHLQERSVHSARNKAIVEEVRQRGPGTDREIAARMGFPHRSAVQPRISDLIKAGRLREVNTVIDPDTRKRVRLVGLSET